MAARLSHPDHPRAVQFGLMALAAGTAIVFVPMWAPLVLAGWFAHLSRSLHASWTRRLGGPRRAAAFLVVALIVALLLPIVIATLSLISTAGNLKQRLAESGGAANALKTLVGDGGGSGSPLETLKSPEKLLEFARQHGQQLFQHARRFGSGLGRALIGIFVFLFGCYTFLVDGERLFAWARRFAPVRPEISDRMARAFHETGRGLLIGVVLTGLVQAGIATIMYLVLGIPSALVLGFVTFLASFIPTVGTGLVWVPIAAGLAMTGRTGAAIALLVVAVVFIALSDNILRPVFSRKGKLDLPEFAVLVAMLGGLAVFGGWGLVLGPLLTRLFVEALRIGRESRLTGAHTTLSPPPPDRGAE